MQIFKQKIILILINSLILFYLTNCSSVKQQCPDYPVKGNLGATINSADDEFSPVFFNGQFLFTRRFSESAQNILATNAKNPELYRIPKLADKSYPVEINNGLPVKDIDQSGVISFYKDANGTTELYFAGASKERFENKNIYMSRKTNEQWTTPFALNINTEYYESHPYISNDGRILLFSSDRPGGQGETDIWASLRMENGAWGEPFNLGPAVNTDANEISPFLNKAGDLYFVSNGYSSSNDIIKAGLDTSGLWGNSYALPEPVNSEFSENSVFVYGDNFYISSNRPGGCGGYDIFRFDRCGPVIIDGFVESLGLPVNLRGTVSLLDENDRELLREDIGNSGKFRFNAEPEKKYKLYYENPCIPEYQPVKEITTPCSDTSTVELKVKISLPDKLNKFDFEEYNVPFFVTGYYKPNTHNNLEELREKFEKGDIGKSAKTAYIENPGEKYNEYAKVVEKALSDATDFILEKIINVQSTCIKGNEHLVIEIYGYADPRPISEKAVYPGPDIVDAKFNFSIKKGASIDNELLSALRAYFTAKYFEQRLFDYELYTNYQNKIEWLVQGVGVDTSDIPEDELKRRVNIQIMIEE